MKKDFFIEVGCSQLPENSGIVSGDVYLQKRVQDRVIFVLSDGSGSGVKANVIASVISSMAIGYTISNEPIARAATAIVETFAKDKNNTKVSQATFTIVSVSDSGDIKIVEFENPKAIIIKENQIADIHRNEIKFKLSSGENLLIYVTEFSANTGDRIVVYSDGISLSGEGTRRMPLGWGEIGVQNFIEQLVKKEPEISGFTLNNKVIDMAEANDLFIPKNDMSCASIFLRKPRKMLICTGPPFDPEKDKLLAETVKNFEGDTLIMGGTTAQIISRELSREISVIMKRDPSGLPPVSTMEGVSLITEGVLTLTKVKNTLSLLTNTDIKGTGTDSKILKMFFNNDHIEFIVGTKINTIHHDPSLPIELELRKSIIKEIGRILETKFLKNVYIKYI